MKKLLLTLAALSLSANLAVAGMFCAAAKKFNYESDVLNYFCVVEIMWEQG